MLIKIFKGISDGEKKTNKKSDFPTKETKQK
jgi:hypothetical protein